MENGAINAFDIAPTATEGGPRSQVPMCLLDDEIHSKAIHRMEMFGPYLCAAAQDKLVSMWNGKENATQCYLLRKYVPHTRTPSSFRTRLPLTRHRLRHKGLFTNMGVDDTSLWCFDESNKKVYKIVMAEHIPTLLRTHHRQQTFDVSDNATLAIEAALTPLRQRESMTSIPDLTRSLTSDLHLADPHPNTSPSATGAGAGTAAATYAPLQHKDFYCDHGCVDALFDRASQWIAEMGDSIRLVGVNTVPVIGTRGTTDALFKTSLIQASYDATLRKKPEAVVSVINIVRVVYFPGAVVVVSSPEASKDGSKADDSDDTPACGG